MENRMQNNTIALLSCDNTVQLTSITEESHKIVYDQYNNYITNEE